MLIFTYMVLNEKLSRLLQCVSDRRLQPEITHPELCGANGGHFVRAGSLMKSRVSKGKTVDLINALLWLRL